MIIKYTFNDGAVLVLHDVGLSDDEVLELEKCHGQCVKVVTAQATGRGIINDRNNKNDD